jgi:DNA-directed RNA polymerase specialized sigma subunit
MSDKAQENYKLIKVYLREIQSEISKKKAEDILLTLNKLFQLEKDFAKRVQSTAAGRKVYFKFIKFINKGRGGIKAARSYFRSRQDTFKDTVNVAIRTNVPSLMYHIPINYNFCTYTLENIDKVNKDGKTINIEVIKDLSNTFSQIKALREEIITKHLYLSLSRAKVFSNNSYNSQSFEDLIQIANIGLITSVDKYVLETDTSNFHRVAIGFMMKSLINDGDDAGDVSIGADDRKKLYSIRRILSIFPDATTDYIAETLEIEESTVKDLLSATFKKSLDDFASEDKDIRIVDIFHNEDLQEMDQYDKVEDNDSKNKISHVLHSLSIFERKVLALKGVKI